jgi:hypothetical protein
MVEIQTTITMRMTSTTKAKAKIATLASLLPSLRRRKLSNVS